MGPGMGPSVLLEVINFWWWSMSGCGYGISFSLQPGVQLHDAGLPAWSLGIYPSILQQACWPCRRAWCRPLSTTLPIMHIRLSMLYFASTVGGRPSLQLYTDGHVTQCRSFGGVWTLRVQIFLSVFATIASLNCMYKRKILLIVNTWCDWLIEYWSLIEHVSNVHVKLQWNQ